MKKIGSKVLLMMVLFVVIFGLNTITSVRSQNRVKRSGLEVSTITESEKKIDVYLKDNNNTKLKDAI